MEDGTALAAVGLFAAFWVAAVLGVVWKQTPAGPRCGKLVTFLILLGLPTWVFCGAGSAFLTVWFAALVVCGQLLPTSSGGSRATTDVVLVTAGGIGLLFTPVVGWSAAKFAARRLRAWLARDPTEDE